MPGTKKETKVKKVAHEKKESKTTQKAAIKKEHKEATHQEAPKTEAVKSETKKIVTEQQNEVKVKTKKDVTYIESTGRRKNAVARVRLSVGDGNLIVNDKAALDYFKDTFLAHQILEQPFAAVEQSHKFNAIIKVHGGGKMAQLNAIVHGLARALDKRNPDFHTTLKKAGFLTRDSRMKERKKFGLLGARTRKPSPKR